MNIEKAKECIRMMIRKQEMPDNAKALGYVYATEAIETVLSELNRLQNVLDERFIHVTGARTVYARLMSLDKEIIVKDDLKLRNELNQCIKDKETLKSELEKKEDNYEMLSKSISSIAKELNLEEDATIDEIYVAIRLLKSKRVNMFEQLECIEKKNKIIDEMARIMQQILVSTEFIKKQWWKRICKCRKDADLVNCSGKLCEDCVKEYFTKKVEEQI